MIQSSFELLELSGLLGMKQDHFLTGWVSPGGSTENKRTIRTNLLDFITSIKTKIHKRGWFSGKISRCHRLAPGSIPGRRTHFLAFFFYFCLSVDLLFFFFSSIWRSHREDSRVFGSTHHRGLTRKRARITSTLNLAYPLRIHNHRKEVG